MGALLGLTFGVGVLLVWQALSAGSRPDQRPSRRRDLHRQITELIAEAGLEGLRPAHLVWSSIGAGSAVGVVFLGISRTVPIALAFAVFAAAVPITLVRRRARQRRSELRELWPEVVDNLVSAVRAGLSLPEAVAQLGSRGPEALRPQFSRFAGEYRATGRFHQCLDRLRERLADPTGDRICETLRIARDVGGSDLGRLLRTLSSFLRDEARTRAELETRQGWVINAARLAVGAPWLMLALFSLRTDLVEAYNRPAGWFVLLVGAGLCVLAYRLMLRLGRLPDESRVLR